MTKQKAARPKFPGYLSIKEFCQKYGVTDAVITRMLRYGLFPNRVRLGRRNWLFPIKGIERELQYLTASSIDKMRLLTGQKSIVDSVMAARILGLARVPYGKPPHKGRIANGGYYYAVEDIVTFAKKSGCWFDQKIVESLLGKNFLDTDSEQSFQPIVKDAQ